MNLHRCVSLRVNPNCQRSKMRSSTAQHKKICKRTSEEAKMSNKKVITSNEVQNATGDQTANEAQNATGNQTANEDQTATDQLARDQTANGAQNATGDQTANEVQTATDQLARDQTATGVKKANPNAHFFPGCDSDSEEDEPTIDIPSGEAELVAPNWKSKVLTVAEKIAEKSAKKRDARVTTDLDDVSSCVYVAEEPNAAVKRANKAESKHLKDIKKKLRASTVARTEDGQATQNLSRARRGQPQIAIPRAVPSNVFASPIRIVIHGAETVNTVQDLARTASRMVQFYPNNAHQFTWMTLTYTSASGVMYVITDVKVTTNEMSVAEALDPTRGGNMTLEDIDDYVEPPPGPVRFERKLRVLSERLSTQIPAGQPDQWRLLAVKHGAADLIPKVDLCAHCVTVGNAVCAVCIGQGRPCSFRNIPTKAAEELKKYGGRGYMPVPESGILQCAMGVTFELKADGKNYNIAVMRDPLLRAAENASRPLDFGEIELRDAHSRPNWRAKHSRREGENESFEEDSEDDLVSVKAVSMTSTEQKHCEEGSELPQQEVLAKTEPKKRPTKHLQMTLQELKLDIKTKAKAERAAIDCPHGEKCCIDHCGHRHPDGHTVAKAKQLIGYVKTKKPKEQVTIPVVEACLPVLENLPCLPGMTAIVSRAPEPRAGPIPVEGSLSFGIVARSVAANPNKFTKSYVETKKQLEAGKIEAAKIEGAIDVIPIVAHATSKAPPRKVSVQIVTATSKGQPRPPVAIDELVVEKTNTMFPACGNHTPAQPPAMSVQIVRTNSEFLELLRQIISGSNPWLLEQMQALAQGPPPPPQGPAPLQRREAFAQGPPPPPQGPAPLQRREALAQGPPPPPPPQGPAPLQRRQPIVPDPVNPPVRRCFACQHGKECTQEECHFCHEGQRCNHGADICSGEKCEHILGLEQRQKEKIATAKALNEGKTFPPPRYCHMCEHGDGCSRRSTCAFMHNGQQCQHGSNCPVRK